MVFRNSTFKEENWVSIFIQCLVQTIDNKKLIEKAIFKVYTFNDIDAS